MKLNKQAVTRNLSRKVLVAKKNSPHIFFGVGVIGIVGSAILACRATLKLEEKLDELKEELDTVQKIDGTTDVVTTEEATKYVAHVSVKTVVVIGKLYGPSVLLGAASVAALTGSHVQLTRRNAALTATVAVLHQAYEEYRLRVQAEIGKERELDIHNGITEQVVDIEGKTQIARISGETGGSPYARMYDASNQNWLNDSEMNLYWLKCQQEYMNARLQHHGHVLLNDVYDALSIERTAPGAVVGWVLEGNGDGYVDFGLYEAHNNEGNRLKSAILLDFNVDGVVYDKI